MFCTRCHRDTGDDPNFDIALLGVDNVLELCRSWLCSDCFDDDDAKRALQSEAR